MDISTVAFFCLQYTIWEIIVKNQFSIQLQTWYITGTDFHEVSQLFFHLKKI